MMRESTRERRLVELLTTLFEARELIQLLSLSSELRVLVPDLPSPPASRRDIAFAAVRMAEERGLVGELFAELKTHRARRQSEIAAFAEEWPAVGQMDARRDATIRHYRAVIGAVAGSIRVIGLRHGHAQPEGRLEHVFVPPKLRRRWGTPPWTVERLLAHLLAPVRGTARVVILGEPGGGKTTLSRFLALVFAGGARVPGIDVPAEVVPLHVALRDYVDACSQHPQMSLLGYLAERAKGLGAAVSERELEELSERGRTVLLVDGLDEAGGATSREKYRDRVVAFCAKYPRVPAVITSRMVGYDEVPLPSGDGGFLRLAIEGLRDDDLPEFMSRAYAALVPEVEGRSSRGATDLLVSVAADPSVRELASNPLLAGLMVLIHHNESRLPAERVALYESCVHTLLHTWPAARGKSFSAIDIDHQRRMLERLAVEVHMGRLREGATPHLIDQGALLDALEGYLRQLDPEAREVRSRVRDWIEFLGEVSGLVVEAAPGRHAFVHRVLQEYLMACWHVRADVDPTETLLERSTDAREHETCLLTVGLLAGDERRCARLFQRVKERSDTPREVWSFLLACLLEEASFDYAAVEEIFAQAVAPMCAAEAPLREKGAVLARLWRFSRRHGTHLRRWFSQRVTGESVHLASWVAWMCAAAGEVESTLCALGARADKGSAAIELAVRMWPLPTSERWPLSKVWLAEIARWAWSQLDVSAVLELFRGRRWRASEVIGVGVMALMAEGDSCVRAGAALQLVLDALLLEDAVTARGVRSSLWLRVMPGEVLLPLARGGPMRVATLYGLGPRPTEAQHHRLPEPCLVHRLTHFVPCLGQGGTVELDLLADHRMGSVHGFSYLAGPSALTPEDFWSSPYAFEGVEEEPDEYGDVAVFDYGNSYPLKEFNLNAAYHLGQQLNISVLEGSAEVPRPDACRALDGHNFVLGMACAREQSEEPVEATVRLLAIHAGHVFAAAEVFEGNADLQRHASVIRQQREWVLQNWLALERQGGGSSEPTMLALYFALGWTQSLSTGTWPGSARWRELLGGAPPVHWWPRVQWHLCWLLHVPEDTSHRRAFANALAEGESDALYGGLARAFRAALGLRDS
ncbi:NACHT domain-containing protein [Nannocystis sp. ILAH1]|nr:NACHT domain-containing protein [Nannocystis sp. ILAH1]MCY0988103.1 NACHT domain-containing protein [Nannocystis sp. ILAH1]